MIDLKKGRQNFRIFLKIPPPPLEKILDPPLHRYVQITKNNPNNYKYHNYNFFELIFSFRSETQIVAALPLFFCSLTGAVFAMGLQLDFFIQANIPLPQIDQIKIFHLIIQLGLVQFSVVSEMILAWLNIST